MELSQNNLKDKIKELINCVTCSKYVGNLDLRVESECGEVYYTLRLGSNCKEASPISLGYQGNESGFLEYLEREFKKRKLQMIQVTKGTLINGDSNVYYPIMEL